MQEAKRLGYLARSAFKLQARADRSLHVDLASLKACCAQEIQDKHRVIPRGGHVLDLGCSPGAWLQARCCDGRATRALLL